MTDESAPETGNGAVTEEAEASSEIAWAGVDEEMARQILAQGEMYLQTQVQLAIAADQRATTAASIFASMATAVAAVFIAVWDAERDGAALAGGLTGAVLLLLASGCAAWAARPTSFAAPGNYPNLWFEGRNSDLVEMLGGECENYQIRINHNELVLKQNRRWIERSFAAAIAAPIASVVVWLLLG